MSTAFNRRRAAAATARALGLDVEDAPEPAAPVPVIQWTSGPQCKAKGYEFVLETVSEEATLTGRAYYDAHDKRFKAACMYEAACRGGRRSRKPRVPMNVGHPVVTKRPKAKGKGKGKAKATAKGSRKRKAQAPLVRPAPLKSCLRKPDAKRRRKAAKIVRFVDPETLPAEVTAEEVENVPFAILSAAESMAAMSFSSGRGVEI